MHPLVCAAFNADFDGDQMAVHIPLSLEAQLEARVLMMSTNNILSPSNGKPIIVPSPDFVLGIYYLSQAEDGEKKPKGIFSSIEEIEQALEAKSISLHSKIVSTFETIDQDGKPIIEKHTSTAGRFLLANVLPKNHNIKFTLINKLLTKKNVSEVIDTIFRYCGQKETVIFCDRIKHLDLNMHLKQVYLLEKMI